MNPSRASNLYHCPAMCQAVYLLPLIDGHTRCKTIHKCKPQETINLSTRQLELSPTPYRSFLLRFTEYCYKFLENDREWITKVFVKYVDIISVIYKNLWCGELAISYNVDVRNIINGNNYSNDWHNIVRTWNNNDKDGNYNNDDADNNVNDNNNNDIDTNINNDDSAMVGIMILIIFTVVITTMMTMMMTIIMTIVISYYLNYWWSNLLPHKYTTRPWCIRLWNWMRRIWLKIPYQ